MNLKENYSLKALNTFGVDVNAKYFLEIKSDNELEEFHNSNLMAFNQLLVLGCGSNILFTKAFEGIVLKYSVEGIRKISDELESVLIESAGGVIWDDLVTFCVQNKLYGIENLALIPGTVGAAPIQNIGAYGVELKDVLHSLEYFDLKSGERKILSNADCKFGYRNSAFKNELKNKTIITKVIFRLSKERKFNLSYKALKEELINISEEELSIQLVSESVKNIRRSKLPDPKVLGNAGSFFKNPEVDSKQYEHLKKKYPELIAFKQENGSFKIAAGWLIEKCGYKGKRNGNVGSYEKQALIIVNHGGASGIEILDFAEKIRNDVEKVFNIKLEYEVNIV